MLGPRSMKILQARDHLANGGDQSSAIVSLMWPCMEARKMVFAQPLYVRSNGGNIHGNPRRVAQTSLPPLFDAEAQIRNEHRQNDQQQGRIVEHGARQPNKFWAECPIGLIRKAR